MAWRGVGGHVLVPRSFRPESLEGLEGLEKGKSYLVSVVWIFLWSRGSRGVFVVSSVLKVLEVLSYYRLEHLPRTRSSPNSVVTYVRQILSSIHGCFVKLGHEI